MKKIKFIASLFMLVLMVLVSIESCTSTKDVIANKSGAQLWGENCLRCHNSPSPVDFSDEEWKTIGLHMQVRANITKAEVEKIVGFLTSAN